MAAGSALILLDPSDSVAVCRRAVQEGEEQSCAGHTVVVLEAIAQGHKIALRAHEPGDTVIKYGRPIGVASAAIRPGDHVHVHNLRTVRGAGAARA